MMKPTKSSFEQNIWKIGKAQNSNSEEYDFNANI